MPEIQATMEKAISIYQTGDKAGALQAFSDGFLLPDYGEVLTRALGSQAFDQAVANVDTMFQVEFPAVQAWDISAEDAARIKQPGLLVLGGITLPVFRQIHKKIRELLPEAESFELPNADHLLMVRNSPDLANALGDFFTRYPI